jgi:DNA-binding response OmpR family regulator
MSRIVVAEGDAAVRRSVEEELTRVGYHVDSVQTLDEAMAALSSEKTADVLLAGLPGSAAMRLVELGRQVSPRTRSVLVPDAAGMAQASAALEHGAVRILNRPIAYDELHDAVETAFECAKGFHGFLHGLSLIDLLQIFHVAGRSVRIRVGGAIEGEIFMRHGELVHAVVGRTLGVDALAVLLTEAECGWIRTSPLGTSFTDTIQARFDGLLLDVLRQSDERSREVAWSMPPMEFSFEDVVKASSRPPESVPPPPPLGTLPSPDDERDAVSSVPPSDLDAVLQEHVASWLRKCQASGMVTTTMQIVAVALASEDGVTLQGSVDSHEAAQAALATRNVIRRLTGDTSAALVEYTTDRGGVVLCWDDERRSLMVLADEIQEGSVKTWFRWRSSALGRAFAPRLYPDDGD